MKKNKYVLPLALFLLLTSACSIGNSGGNNSTTYYPNNTTSNGASLSNSVASNIDDHYQENNGDFKIETDVVNGYTVSENVYTIVEEGDYTISGTLKNGQIRISADEKKVNLLLNGVTMTSSIDSLIYVEKADKVSIKALEDTYNELNDIRTLKDDSSSEDIGNAAIYSKEDLDLKGKGILVVKSSYNNGIHTKDDLKIKNLTLKVDAINNAIKGNDSITIESGDIIAIARGGNGLKTSSSDVSSKGNQKGTITILEGNVYVYAALDAIDAAYDVIINNEDESLNLNLYTGKYSSYTGDVIESSSTTIYLKIKNSIYSSSYRYAALFYNSDSDYVWENANYYQVEQGDRTTYYVYKISIPSNYENIQFYKFDKNQGENSFDNYISKCDGGKINQNNDAYIISRDSNGTLTGSWSIYKAPSYGGMGGMDSGNKDKSEHSAKGIKAYNNVSINGGLITIEAHDDGIHSTRGETLENDSTGIGDITIDGGTFNIKSCDDGIHADHILTINGGQVNITESYEGLEANQIYIKGGTHKIYASDDGLNAKKGDLSILIQVEGGYLESEVGDGDTDAIDSNGDYVQKGGIVIAKGGSSSGMASALDIDGIMTMTGGTFIAAGSVCTTPSSSSSINYVLFGTVSSMGGGPGGGPRAWGGNSTTRCSFSAGNYTISGTDISFTLKLSYTNLLACSDSFKLNSSYTISNGSTTYTWTQSSSSVTYK